MAKGLERPLGELRALVRRRDFAALEALLERRPELLWSDDPEVRTLLALRELLQNRPEEAAVHLEAIEPGRIGSAAGKSDYALLLFLLGRRDEALSWIEAACQSQEADAYAFGRKGTFLLAEGRLEEAELAFEEALRRDPNLPELLANLAALKLRRGLLEEALQLTERALALNPDLTPLRERRQNLLLQLGRAEELLEELEGRKRAEPENLEVRLQLALAYRRLSSFWRAEGELLSAIDRFPGDPRPYLLLCRWLLEREEPARLLELVETWLETLPEEAPHRPELERFRLEALIRAGSLEEAERKLRALKGRDPTPHLLLLEAKLLAERGEVGEGISRLEALLERLPGYLEAYGHLIELLEQTGRLDEARRYAGLLAELHPEAVVRKVEAADYEASDEELALLERLFSQKTAERETRAAVGFTLHRVLDRRGDYRRAFAVLRESNDLIKETLSYDFRHHRRLVEETVALLTGELVDRLREKGHPSRRPIFVLGMPRSGTTLTEQLLAAHSRVAGAGELPYIPKIAHLMHRAIGAPAPYPAAFRHMTPEELRRAGAYYLHLAERHVGEAPFFVDKLPHNFDYLGLIALLFPNAKIVSLRRAPLDVALSNYQQLFAARHGLMGFAFDLEWIGEMLCDHQRIMEHWRELFGERIFELEYERLVAEPERTARALLEFCELPWEPQVLRFFENRTRVRTASVRQVRRGIHRGSVEKWRRYGEGLRPVAAILERGFRPLSALDRPAETIVPQGLWGFTG